MAPPQQGQPPEQHVYDDEDDPRMEPRYGQQMGQPAAGVGRAQVGGDAATLACGHRLDDGAGFGLHREPLQPFDGPAVEVRGMEHLPVEDRPLPDPQRPGIAPPRHQPAVALRTAPERAHRAPAADALSGPEFRQRIGIEPDPGVRSVPVPVRRVPPGRYDGIGRRVARPLDGKPLHDDLVEGVHLARDAHFGSPELCGGESRREEHRRGGSSRTQQQGHDSRTDESPCEKPQGQFVRSGQGDPRGEGREELDHRHTVEPIQQAGDFHTCKIHKIC